MGGASAASGRPPSSAGAAGGFALGVAGAGGGGGADGRTLDGGALSLAAAAKPFGKLQLLELLTGAWRPLWAGAASAALVVIEFYLLDAPRTAFPVIAVDP